MHGFLDREVHRSRLKHWDPAAKMLLAAAGLAAAAAATSPTAPLLTLALFTTLTLGAARATPRTYAALFAIPATFAIPTLAYLLLLTGTGPVLHTIPLGPATLTVTQGGLDHALLVLSRFLGGTSAMLFLALTTPPTEIFATLRSLGLPAAIAETALLVYRYTFLLLDEATRIRTAQTLRGGYRTRKTSLSSLSLLGGSLLLHTWDRAESLDRAMRSRCYHGKMHTPQRPRNPSQMGIALALATLLALAATL